MVAEDHYLAPLLSGRSAELNNEKKGRRIDQEPPPIPRMDPKYLSKGSKLAGHEIIRKLAGSWTLALGTYFGNFIIRYF